MSRDAPRYVRLAPPPRRRSDFLRADWLVFVIALLIVAVALPYGAIYLSWLALEEYLALDAALRLPGAAPPGPGR